MKILVVTNLYPPHHLGGYELGCRDIVEKLRARGHAVQVLTSSFRNGDIETPPGETGVERTLQFSPTPPPGKRAECRKLAGLLKHFSPDVVYFSNQAGLCQWLPVVARRHHQPMAFFLSDTSFASWRVGAWLMGWAGKKPETLTPALSPLERGEGEEKNTAVGDGERCSAPSLPGSGIHRIIRVLFGKTFLVRGWPVVRNRTCHFCSDFIRQTAAKNEIAVGPSSLVTHWGIDPAQFTATPRARWPVRRLLYVGRLSPQKGVHTALAALRLLAGTEEYSDLTLTLAGGGPDLEYGGKMRALAAQSGLAGRVRFLGELPRAELPRIYAEHDVLVFPSEWDEPFAITPLEAMACGLAVVGTLTGGSGELFRDRETAMTFAAGDAADCARALRELCADRELFETICRNAQREVREKHTLDAMVDKIEASLMELKGRP